MSEQLSWPTGDGTADGGRSGTAQLACAALASPAPPPGAEAVSQERALAQFRGGALAPRPLRAMAAPVAPSLAQRLGRALKRLLWR